MLTVTLIIVMVVTLVIYQYYRSRNLPPGPWGLPLLGYLPFLGKNPEKKLTELSDKYGKVLSVNLGGFRPVIVLSDWKSVREALVIKGEIFSGRSFDLYTKILFNDRDIVFHDGPNWKKQKKLGKQFLHKVNCESVIMEQVDKLSQFLDSHDGHQVHVHDLFCIPIINVIWSIVTGKAFGQFDVDIRNLDTKLQFVLSCFSMNWLSHFPFLIHVMPDRFGYTKFREVVWSIHDYIRHEIDSHLRGFDKDNLRDGIDIYLAEIEKKKLQKGKEIPPYDRTHLTMTVLDFFIAGNETVRMALSWALLYMVHFPQIQQKVQQELDKVVDRDSFVPFQSKSLIPYTEATLMEIQRVASIFPLAVPHRAMQDTSLSGYDIPKDTKVIVNLYGVHRDREYWGDPEAFRPERFLDDDGQVVRHEALKPFSAGPRVCLGEGLAKQELHLFFTCLMRRFTFQFVPGKPRPSLEPIFSVTYQPRPFSLNVRRR